jgi:hypothetical protein
MAREHRYAEIIASMCEYQWFIENDPLMSRHFREIPRTRENLDQAWSYYQKLRDERVKIDKARARAHKKWEASR